MSSEFLVPKGDKIMEPQPNVHSFTLTLKSPNFSHKLDKLLDDLNNNISLSAARKIVDEKLKNIIKIKLRSFDLL